MLVKIGNKIYNPNDEPIMVILSPQDRINIQCMPANGTRYAAFPKEVTREEAEKFMELDTDKKPGKPKPDIKLLSDVETGNE